MHPTLKKLNLTGQSAGQPEVLVLRAPESFETVLDTLDGLTTVRREAKAGQDFTFALAFCIQQAEVDAFADLCARHSQGDATIWVAYPKQSSRRYRCEFNRDTGWAAFGARGFEPVRQVAIDEDWSALRLRRVQYIKTLTRKSALSEAGQARLAGQGEGEG